MIRTLLLIAILAVALSVARKHDPTATTSVLETLNHAAQQSIRGAVREVEELQSEPADKSPPAPTAPTTTPDRPETEARPAQANHTATTPRARPAPDPAALPKGPKTMPAFPREPVEEAALPPIDTTQHQTSASESAPDPAPVRDDAPPEKQEQKREVGHQTSPVRSSAPVTVSTETEADALLRDAARILAGLPD